MTKKKVADNLEKHSPFRQKQTFCIIMEVFCWWNCCGRSRIINSFWMGGSRLIPRDLAHCPEMAKPSQAVTQIPLDQSNQLSSLLTHKSRYSAVLESCYLLLTGVEWEFIWRGGFLFLFLSWTVVWNFVQTLEGSRFFFHASLASNKYHEKAVFI